MVKPGSFQGGARPARKNETKNLTSPGVYQSTGDK
jgi:hypothetical protein